MKVLRRTRNSGSKGKMLGSSAGGVEFKHLLPKLGIYLSHLITKQQLPGVRGPLGHSADKQEITWGVIQSERKRLQLILPVIKKTRSQLSTVDRTARMFYRSFCKMSTGTDGGKRPGWPWDLL